MGMKKLLFSVLSGILVFSMVGCTSSSSSSSSSDAASSASTGGDTTAKIGVSMPTKSLQRWNQDGSNMKAALEQAGFAVDLQYAGDNDIPTQVAQIENMITSKCDVLVIAAVDGSSLTGVLDTAKQNNIPVIAYDRLIMNSDAVSYYATFDNNQVGQMQGEFIRDQLDLDNKEGPFNMELFTGSSDDNNVNFFFGGAMKILQPYIDSGKIVVPSGQTTMAQAATPNWSTEESQRRMETLISAQNYSPTGTRLDAVLSSNDSVANGVTNALVSAGYTKDNFPLLTGQDCDLPSVKNMIAGLQSMSIFKDTRTLADQVVKMTEAIVKGTEVEVNDTTTYDNGSKVVPSYLLPPMVVTVENYREMLIDSGYYTEADLAS